MLPALSVPLHLIFNLTFIWFGSLINAWAKQLVADRFSRITRGLNSWTFWTWRVWRSFHLDSFQPFLSHFRDKYEQTTTHGGINCTWRLVIILFHVREARFNVWKHYLYNKVQPPLPVQALHLTYPLNGTKLAISKLIINF